MKNKLIELIKKLESIYSNDNPNYIMVSAPKDSPLVIYSIGGITQIFYKN